MCVKEWDWDEIYRREISKNNYFGGLSHNESWSNTPQYMQ